jgi:hypothetical protein
VGWQGATKVGGARGVSSRNTNNIGDNELPVSAGDVPVF